jgi:hypothetical protein
MKIEVVQRQSHDLNQKAMQSKYKAYGERCVALEQAHDE